MNLFCSTSIKAPCGRDCHSREVGCHGKCDAYKQYRKKVDIANAKYHIEKQKQRIMYSAG